MPAKKVSDLKLGVDMMKQKIKEDDRNNIAHHPEVRKENVGHYKFLIKKYEHLTEVLYITKDGFWTKEEIKHAFYADFKLISDSMNEIKHELVKHLRN